MNFTVEHLGLAAREPVALKDWYVRMFGAKLVFDNGQTPPGFLLVMPGGFMLEIYQADSSHKEVSNNKLAGWRHVALRVDSIEAARVALEKNGIRFTEPINPASGGGRVLYFQDAEGNLLHLVERTAASIVR